jgi:hypothetical protein
MRPDGDMENQVAANALRLKTDLLASPEVRFGDDFPFLYRC